MYYKQKEIQEYIDDRIKESVDYDKDYLEKDTYDIHNELFNEDYYMIGYYNCRKWMGDKAFEIIGIIKEYEEDNFGEVNTDFSSEESVVNMYTYIVGEHLLNEMKIGV